MLRRTAGVTGIRLEDLPGGGGYWPGLCKWALAAVTVGVDDEDVVERGMVVVSKASVAVPGSEPLRPGTSARSHRLHGSGLGAGACGGRR
jgi:hypothetical protein